MLLVVAGWWFLWFLCFQRSAQHSYEAFSLFSHRPGSQGSCVEHDLWVVLDPKSSRNRKNQNRCHRINKREPNMNWYFFWCFGEYLVLLRFFGETLGALGILFASFWRLWSNMHWLISDLQETQTVCFSWVLQARFSRPSWKNLPMIKRSNLNSFKSRERTFGTF